MKIVAEEVESVERKSTSRKREKKTRVCARAAGPKCDRNPLFRGGCMSFFPTDSAFNLSLFLSLSIYLSLSVSLFLSVFSSVEEFRGRQISPRSVFFHA